MNNHIKKECLVIGIIALWALVIQATNITFGLPRLFEFKGSVVEYWFNDEVKEVEHIKSLLTPRAEMLHFNYPSLQYLLVSAVLLPSRLLNGEVPEDWIISVTSRIVSAAAIVASVIMLFLIGKKIDYLGGLAAALLFSVSPIAAVLGKDVKPIALSGLLILLAIYLALDRVKGLTERNRFVGIGILLGMSVMCSHLALAFLHLPIVAYFLGRPGTGNELPKEAQEGAARSPVRTVGLIAAIALALALGGLVMATWERGLTYGIGKYVYSLQTHGKPFEYHQAQIDAYLGLARKGLLFLSVVLAAFLTYLWKRERLVYGRGYEALRFMEYAYGSALITAIVVLGVATVLNPLIPIAVFRFVSSARDYMSMRAGYYGMHPGQLGAPGFLTIIRYAVGVPLTCLSIVSVIYLSTLYKNRNRIWIVVLIFAPYLLQLLTWNDTFRASRFLYYITIAMVLLSGVFLGQMIAQPRKVVRAIGIVILIFVFYFNASYTISYLRTLSYRNDPRVLAAEWIDENVEKGSSIAVKGTSDLPRNLGPIENLQGYRYRLFNQSPDYCVIDGFEYLVMEQYALKTFMGYRYVGKDWWPSETGVDEEAAAQYTDIVTERKYKMIGAFRYKVTTTLGIRNDFRLLLDPAEYYHKEIYVFKRIA